MNFMAPPAITRNLHSGRVSPRWVCWGGDGFIGILHGTCGSSRSWRIFSLTDGLLSVPLVSSSTGPRISDSHALEGLPHDVHCLLHELDGSARCFLHLVVIIKGFQLMFPPLLSTAPGSPIPSSFPMLPDHLGFAESPRMIPSFVHTLGLLSA